MDYEASPLAFPSMICFMMDGGEPSSVLVNFYFQNAEHVIKFSLMTQNSNDS